MRLCGASYSYRDYIPSQLDLLKYISLAYNLGWDAVEIHINHFPAGCLGLENKEFLRSLKQHALGEGIAIAGISASNDFGVPSDDERKKQVEHLLGCVDLAFYLGAPLVRAFGGKVPKGYNKSQAIQWAIAALKNCVLKAEALGVTIALENHGGLTETSDDINEIISSVDSKWLGVNLDTNNFPDDKYEQIEDVVYRVVHVHAKFLEVSERGGERLLDYNRILKILNDAEYRSYISIEYEGKEDSKTAVPKATRFLRATLQRLGNA